MPKPWYSLEDLAARYEKSYDSVWRMVKSGEIQGKRVGRTWRVSAEALAAYEADGLPGRSTVERVRKPTRPLRSSPRVSPGCAA